MSIELMMPSNHLILCHSLLLLPSIFPSIWVFSNESPLRIRWPRDWRFSFSNSPFNEYSELIFLRIDRFDLLAVQRTLRVFSSTLQSSFTVILAYNCCLVLNPHEWTLKTSYLYSSLWISLCKHVLSRSGGCTGAGGPRGAIPRWRSGRAAVRRYPSSKVRETQVRW